MPNEPPKLSPLDLARRQTLIDAAWERTLIERQYIRERAQARSSPMRPRIRISTWSRSSVIIDAGMPAGITPA